MEENTNEEIIDSEMNEEDEFSNEDRAVLSQDEDDDEELQQFDYEQLEEYKIDEDMPEELKQQLRKLNERAKRINNALNAKFEFDEDDDDDSDDEDYDDMDDDSDDTLDIEEDNSSVGELF